MISFPPFFCFFVLHTDQLPSCFSLLRQDLEPSHDRPHTILRRGRSRLWVFGFWVLHLWAKKKPSIFSKQTLSYESFWKNQPFFFSKGTILFDNSTAFIRFPRRFFNVSKNDKYSKGSPFHVRDQLLYQRILHHKRTVCRSPAWRPRDGKTIPTNKEGEIWTENLWDLWQFMIYRLLWNSPQHQPITCCVTWWLKRTDNRAGKHGNCDQFINIHQTETQLSSFPGK